MDAHNEPHLVLMESGSSDLIQSTKALWAEPSRVCCTRFIDSASRSECRGHFQVGPPLQTPTSAPKHLAFVDDMETSHRDGRYMILG